MTKKILILAVNYNNYLITIQFIKEFKSLYLNKELADLIIVDNASDINRIGELNKYTCENIRILTTSENLGYFGAAKYALEKKSKDIDIYDHIIVANNDIEFPQKEILLTLSEKKISDNMGCIAPQVIIKNTKFNQNPYMVSKPSKKYIKFNSFFLAKYNRMVLRDLLSKVKQKIKGKTKKEIKSDRSIFAPHGSFVIFTKEYFNKGGYIDAGYFLYGEELSVGYQCLALDLKIIYDNSLLVVHNEHQTTIGRYSKFKYKCQKEAFKYILERYNVRTLL
jgi:GT2 family glycosyltransferase